VTSTYLYLPLSIKYGTAVGRKCGALPAAERVRAHWGEGTNPFGMILVFVLAVREAAVGVVAEQSARQRGEHVLELGVLLG